MENREVVETFYACVSGGDAAGLENLLADDFELVVPTGGGNLSGRYVGKQRFMADVIMNVFGCVNPEDIVFCKKHAIICAEGDRVVSIAQNEGVALSGKKYDQIYAHMFTVRDNKVAKLVEFFDTDLANRALWKTDMQAIEADEPFRFSQIN